MLDFLLKDDVKNFISEHSIAVIATVNRDGKPSTSAIYYIVDKHNTIRFLTKTETTKYINLSHIPHAAVTIMDLEKPITVSLEGTVRQITDASEHHEVLQAVTKLGNEKLGDYAPIIKLHKGSFAAFEFLPKHGKMTDFTGSLATTKEQLHDF